MAKFNVPDQKYLRIGDVSRLLGVKPSVIRFWETQFPRLKPRKTRRGQRIFSPKDVELLKMIRRELKETGMTIEGLKKKMAESGGAEKPDPNGNDIKTETLLRIRDELQGILDFLKTGE
ncbi:MAG: MerR family transcriptional regulator [Acidobacteria bacterium]|nr:MerR family transcriptional regulator [Acidobacteriota bacterium]